MFTFLKTRKKNANDMRRSNADVVGRGAIYVPESEIINSQEYKDMQKWAESIIMGKKERLKD
ncbi:MULTISPECIES: hypothetical protein [Pantoea]|uniref:hypothetical protein n=1 Tax=Pantoea TaxID=53335 RepID=UPI0010C180D1|nr:MULTISPECIES: hypothetical protein [Pantoea]TKJ60593.1 hypothetical protein PagCFBP13505_00625 [Pantoea agglomerans]